MHDYLPTPDCARCDQPCTGNNWSAPFDGADFTPTHDTCPEATR